MLIAFRHIQTVEPRFFRGLPGLKEKDISGYTRIRCEDATRHTYDGVKIELLEPTSPESTIAKFLEKGGRGVHHMAFAIEDGVANALAECNEKGIRLIDQAPRPGAEQMSIAFLHPKSTVGVLTELCEPQNK